MRYFITNKSEDGQRWRFEWEMWFEIYALIWDAQSVNVNAGVSVRAWIQIPYPLIIYQILPYGILLRMIAATDRMTITTAALVVAGLSMARMGMNKSACIMTVWLLGADAKR